MTARKMSSRIRWLASIIAGVIAASGVAACSALGSTSQQRSGDSTANGSLLPKEELSASSGFVTVPSMTRIISGPVPLWTGKDGPGPYKISSYGLVGSLSQGFVLDAAVSRFGTLSSRPPLPLPLPLVFASEHQGPAEVFDIVWEFSNSWAPITLLHDPVFTNTDVPGVSAVPSGSVHGGLAWEVVSDANGGLSEFRFEWADGNRLVAVSVLGAKLSLEAARNVALGAGS